MVAAAVLLSLVLGAGDAVFQERDRPRPMVRAVATD
jgi:hypothetical protein